MGDGWGGGAVGGRDGVGFDLEMGRGGGWARGLGEGEEVKEGGSQRICLGGYL